MKVLFSLLCVLAFGTAGWVSGAETPGKGDDLANAAALLQDHHPIEASVPALTLEDVGQIALAANPSRSRISLNRAWPEKFTRSGPLDAKPNDEAFLSKTSLETHFSNRSYEKVLTGVAIFDSALSARKQPCLCFQQPSKRMSAPKRSRATTSNTATYRKERL